MAASSYAAMAKVGVCTFREAQAPEPEANEVPRHALFGCNRPRSGDSIANQQSRAPWGAPSATDTEKEMRTFLIVLICVLILGATIGGSLAGGISPAPHAAAVR